MVDLYNNAHRYGLTKSNIDLWGTTTENKQVVKRYLTEQVDNLSPGARYATIIFLKRIFHGKEQGSEDGELKAKPFIREDISKHTLEDFRKVDERIKKEHFKKDTYSKITNHIRRIYEQEFEESSEPNHLKVLSGFAKTGRRAFFQYPRDEQYNESLNQERYYTYKEFEKILRTATKPQDRALLSVAWETTSRPNEYLSVKIGDVEPMKNGFKIRAHISKKKGGQTNTRNLYLIQFRAEFADFWNKHPFKDDPEAPLFYREDNSRDFGKSLSPPGANKKLKTLDFRSGVKKNGTLYFLRHGGYTWKKANGMKEALAGKDMGWVPGSKQARRYEHLQDDDLLQERLRLADERFEKEQLPKITSRVCPFCNQENSPTNTMCSNCGQTLSLQSVTKELETMKRQQETMIEEITAQILKKMKDEREKS